MDEYCNRLYGYLQGNENETKNFDEILYEIEEPIRDVQFILAEIRFNRNYSKESIKNKIFSWFKGAKSKIKMYSIKRRTTSIKSWSNSSKSNIK